MTAHALHDQPHMVLATKTDPGTEWDVSDHVQWLGRWGRDESEDIKLPADAIGELVFGASSSAAIRIDNDPKVSKTHARIVGQGAMWSIEDLKSRNGTWIDSVRCETSFLRPGTVIRIGDTRFIAFSERLAALRELLRRWIGWGDEHRSDVDRALRSVRKAFTARSPLILFGQDGLTPVAARLHREVLSKAPFVVAQDERELEHASLGVQRGALCVASIRDPRAFAKSFKRLHERIPRIIVCALSSDETTNIVDELENVDIETAVRVRVPPLATRKQELPRILRGYAHEFETSLDMVSTYTDEDIAMLARWPYGKYAEIEFDAPRLVVLRGSPQNIRAGSPILERSPSAFSRWAKRRGLRVKQKRES